MLPVRTPTVLCGLLGCRAGWLILQKQPFPLHLLCSERFKRCWVVIVVGYLKRTVVGFLIEAGYNLLCELATKSDCRQSRTDVSALCVCGLVLQEHLKKKPQHCRYEIKRMYTIISKSDIVVHDTVVAEQTSLHPPACASSFYSIDFHISLSLLLNNNNIK